MKLRTGKYIPSGIDTKNNMILRNGKTKRTQPITKHYLQHEEIQTKNEKNSSLSFGKVFGISLFVLWHICMYFFTGYPLPISWII